MKVKTMQEYIELLDSINENINASAEHLFVDMEDKNGLLNCRVQGSFTIGRIKSEDDSLSKEYSIKLEKILKEFESSLIKLGKEYLNKINQ